MWINRRKGLSPEVHLVTALMCCITCIAIARALNSTTATVAMPQQQQQQQPSTVIFTHSTGLDSLNLNTFSAHELFANGDAVFQVDALYVNISFCRLFWSDLQRGRIYGATYEPEGDVLRDVEEVAVVTNGVVEGIAVDWIGFNVYWVESRFGHIGVVRLSKMINVTTLLTDMESPRAIAVDSNKGLLFWTDWDEHAPRIERCSLSGAERTIIVRTLNFGGGFPNGLAIDYALRRIYWIDAKSSGIYSTDYDGLGHVELVTNHPSIQWPFGLSVFEKSLFWVDAELKTINQIVITNANDVHVLYKTYRSLYGILVLHPKRHPHSDMNPCANNGGCSHLCTLESGGRRSVCHCPHMMSLSSEDLRTCHNVRNVMLVSERHEGVNLIQVLDAGNVVFRVVAFPLVAHNVGDMYGLNMDLSSGTIYWADGRTNTVWRASIADGKISRVFDLGFGNLTGFAADLFAKNFFYSMLGPHGGIFQCNLRPNYSCRRSLLDVDRPLGLFFQSATKQIYWIESRVDETYVVRTATQNSSTGDFGSVHDALYAYRLPTDFMVDFEGTIYWTTIGDVHSVHRLIGNRSSNISIPEEAGVVTAMTTKNRKLTVGTSSGRVLTVEYSSYIRSPRTPAEEWSVTHYKTKGIVAGLAYASMPINEEPVSKLAPTIVQQNDDTTDSTCPITCLNDGVCGADPSGDIWTCICPRGFRDRLCENSVCSSWYCKHGGRCEMNLAGRLVCECPSDWSGQRCQFRKYEISTNVTGIVPLHVCDPLYNFCLNGGTCVVSEDGNESTALPRCSCPAGPYVGTRCEIDSTSFSAHSSSSIVLDVAMCALLVASIATLVVFLYKQRWRSAKTMVNIAPNIGPPPPRATEMSHIPLGAESVVRLSSKRLIDNDRLKLLSNCQVEEEEAKEAVCRSVYA